MRSVPCANADHACAYVNPRNVVMRGRRNALLYVKVTLAAEILGLTDG